MNEVIAANIRSYRELRSWTQEQLAEAAVVHVRTVQRAEDGRGMSAETLLAIAGAFDVSVDELRVDSIEVLGRALGVPKSEVTPELIAEKVTEMEAKYTNIPLVRVQSSADLHCVFGAHALFFACESKDDSALDVAAELEQYMSDLLDIGVVEPTHEREFEKEAFAMVKKLDGLGFVVSAGFHRHGLRLADGEILPWSTLYVIVAAKAEAKQFALVEKNMRFSFA